MRRYRWWHRLLGHGKAVTPVFNPEDHPPDMMAIAATTVRDVCPSCGDAWVFSGMTFSEVYLPAPTP